MTGAEFAARVLRTACLGFLFISTLDVAAAIESDDKEQAGDCLKNPKGAAPPGERWRYRVERGTKRHCWYTRTDGPRKVAAQGAPAAKPVKSADTLDAAPLQLSVANARAEADLSAPVEQPPITESRNPSWTLAERWSQNAEAAPTVQAEQRPVRPPPPSAPVEPPDNAAPESLIEIAAGTVALLGLSVVLIAMLIRRRKANESFRAWERSRSDPDEGPDEPLTDLNDEPLMTWRKKPKERLEFVRRSAELRDATSMRAAKPSPTASAGLRRTPTIPPGARA